MVVIHITNQIYKLKIPIYIKILMLKNKNTYLFYKGSRFISLVKVLFCVGVIFCISLFWCKAAYLFCKTIHWKIAHFRQSDPWLQCNVAQYADRTFFVVVFIHFFSSFLFYFFGAVHTVQHANQYRQCFLTSKIPYVHCINEYILQKIMKLAFIRISFFHLVYCKSPDVIRMKFRHSISICTDKTIIDLFRCKSIF